MKKFLISLLAFAMVTVLAACGEKKETAAAETVPTEDNISVTVDAGENSSLPDIDEPESNHFASNEAKDCFYDAGYVEFIAGADKSAEYTFTAENSEGITWCVYVFDAAFDDGYRYISQAAEPVLNGDGTISVAEGQFVYVHCSANEFTADSANETAKLNVTVA